MIIATQICLMVLLFYVLWCEYSPFFKDTLISISLRLSTSVILLVCCYHANKLSSLPYPYQFFVLLFSLVLLLCSVKYILHKYKINQQRLQKIMFRKMRCTNGHTENN